MRRQRGLYEVVSLERLERGNWVEIKHSLSDRECSEHLSREDMKHLKEKKFPHILGHYYDSTMGDDIRIKSWVAGQV